MTDESLAIDALRTSLEDKLDSVVASIDLLTTSIGTLNTSIGTLNTSVGTMSTNIVTAIGTLSTDIQTKIDAIIAEMGSQLTSTNSSLASLVSDVSLFNSKVDTFLLAFGAIGDNSNLVTSMNTINGHIQTLLAVLGEGSSQSTAQNVEDIRNDIRDSFAITIEQLKKAQLIAKAPKR